AASRAAEDPAEQGQGRRPRRRCAVLGQRVRRRTQLLLGSSVVSGGELDLRRDEPLRRPPEAETELLVQRRRAPELEAGLLDLPRHPQKPRATCQDRGRVRRGEVGTTPHRRYAAECSPCARAPPPGGVGG